MGNVNDLVCPICGQPTSVYMGNARKDRLCRQHAKDFKDGLLKQCEDCGKWIKSDEACDCKRKAQKYDILPTSGFEKCVACGETTNGYAFCKKCFRKHSEAELLDILNNQVETQTPFIDEPEKIESVDLFSKTDNDSENKVMVSDNKNKLHCIICGEVSDGSNLCKACVREVFNCQNNLDKNKKSWELIDYYYNLNNFIERLKKYDEGISNLYKMYAIASLLQKLYNNNQLIERVDDDIKKLKKKLERIKDFTPNDTQLKIGKTLVALADDKNRASDGHICKSKGEVTIDNILFKFQVCHAYGRKVKEIPNSERAITADWFVPLSGADGIYIEYWGMDTSDYEDNKEEKLEIYEKYKDAVKLIEINKNDINDSQTLEDNLYQKLKMFGWK